MLGHEFGHVIKQHLASYRAVKLGVSGIAVETYNWRQEQEFEADEEAIELTVRSSVEATKAAIKSPANLETIKAFWQSLRSLFAVLNLLESILPSGDLTHPPARVRLERLREQLQTIGPTIGVDFFSEDINHALGWVPHNMEWLFKRVWSLFQSGWDYEQYCNASREAAEITAALTDPYAKAQAAVNHILKLMPKVDLS